MSITANLERVRNELADASARAGRSGVKLMAVSKTHPADAILEAVAAGQRLFGENRVQEFSAKNGDLSSVRQSIDCCLIGPLQSNKTGPAAGLFDSVTVDSLKIAQRLNSASSALGKILPIMVEVKLSPEESKHGLAPEDLPTLLAALALLTNLRPAGLMTVPPFTDDPEGARPYFARLRQLRDENQDACPTLTELSMGMSHDFVVAVAEGATIIRVGTAIFGKREYPA